MKPTVSIHFPTLSTPTQQASITTDADDIFATIKTTTIIHYTQTTITLNTPVTTRTAIQLPETGLYLFILVAGHYVVERTDAPDIPVVPSTHHCQAFYVCRGEYFVVFTPGRHRLVCYAMSAAWIQRLKRTLPLINEVSVSMEPYQQALIFPRYRLPDMLTTHLISPSYTSLYEETDVELEYFHNLNRIMAYYDKLLVQTRRSMAPKMQYREIVHRFIEHCNRPIPIDSQRSVEAVAAAIDIPVKTLNRAFHRISNGTITAGRLLRQIRMTSAHKLLTEKVDITVGNVAHLLGYAETSAFTKAYRKTWGHLPSEARNFAEESLPALGPYRPE